jgi:hypothetical protein
MSIENLIKNSREYMDAAGPVQLEFDYPQVSSIPEREASCRRYGRYGPKDSPEPNPPVMQSEKKKPDENEPLAYCPGCKTYRRMKWKPPEQRGKDADSWFVCAECGGDKLELKMLSYSEAARKNRTQDNDDPVPF